jgi:hypothetical protein
MEELFEHIKGQAESFSTMLVDGRFVEISILECALVCSITHWATPCQSSLQRLFNRKHFAINAYLKIFSGGYNVRTSSLLSITLRVVELLSLCS